LPCRLLLPRAPSPWLALAPTHHTGNCTAALAQQLAAAGVPVDRPALSATLTKPHTLSINLLLAAGFTERQAAEGRVDALLAWLSGRENVRAALAAGGLSGGAGAAVTWLQRPEVVLDTAAAAAARQAATGGGSGGGGANGRTAIAAGLAAPLGAAVAALTGAVAALALRRRRQQHQARGGPGKAEGGTEAGDGGAAAADDRSGGSRRQVRGRDAHSCRAGSSARSGVAHRSRGTFQGIVAATLRPASAPPLPRAAPRAEQEAPIPGSRGASCRAAAVY
jgi:hypothetical protein